MDYNLVVKNIKNPKLFGMKTPLKELEKILKYALDKYHNDEEIMSDQVYDELLECLKKRDPKNKLLTQVGVPIRDNIEKIKLPYWMGSMDKATTSEQLNRFINKYNKNYSVSEKLDGLSALLVYNKNTTPILTTRGNGSVGQNISYIIPYLNLPTLDKNITIRGELIINKKKFNDKYKLKYPKPRTLVSGIINSKNPDKKIISDIDFVAYEIIFPTELKPSKQFELLQQLGFKIANNLIIDSLDYDKAVSLLLQMKSDSEYEIDGIIFTNNTINERNKSGNPKYAIAFKMKLEDQIRPTIVQNVEWNPSKHGALKPRIKFKTITIGGDKISYTTGFHAKYIKENKIGIGTELKIIRSGDVIPYILEVTKPTEPLMPINVKYHWSKNNIDIILDDADTNENVIIKKLLHFFKTCKVPFVNIGFITKLVNNNITNIKHIYNLTVDELIELPGIQQKSATKLYESIHNIFDNPIELHVIMSASGVFGSGFGEKKLLPLITKYPNILTRTTDLKKEDLMIIEGYSNKTSESFIKNFVHFKEFLNKNTFLKVKSIKKRKMSKTILKGKFYNQVIVFSGVRNSDLEKYIESEGGIINNTINNKVTLLIVKDINANSSKIKKAKELQIEIISIDEFSKKIDF